MFLLHVIYTRAPWGETGGQDNLASCFYRHICQVNPSDLFIITAAPHSAPSHPLHINLVFDWYLVVISNFFKHLPFNHTFF